MASPQAENGHIDIANEIAEALMKINLSAYETRVLWFIFRKTYGWKKKEDWLSLSQFSDCTGLDRRLVHRALKGLEAKQIIVINRDDREHPRYGFQKNYRKWRVSSKKMTVINRDDGLSSKEMTRLSSKEIPTKDNYTKDTITKERALVPEWVPPEAWKGFVEMRRKMRKPMTERAKKLIFGKLETLRAEGHDPETVLDQSIERGWQGVFPIKEDYQQSGPTPTTYRQAQDAEKRAMFQWLEKEDHFGNNENNPTGNGSTQGGLPPSRKIGTGAKGAG